MAIAALFFVGSITLFQPKLNDVHATVGISAMAFGYALSTQVLRVRSDSDLTDLDFTVAMLIGAMTVFWSTGLGIAAPDLSIITQSFNMASASWLLGVAFLGNNDVIRRTGVTHLRRAQQIPTFIAFLFTAFLFLFEVGVFIPRFCRAMVRRFGKFIPTGIQQLVTHAGEGWPKRLTITLPPEKVQRRWTLGPVIAGSAIYFGGTFLCLAMLFLYIHVPGHVHRFLTVKPDLTPSYGQLYGALTGIAAVLTCEAALIDNSSATFLFKRYRTPEPVKAECPLCHSRSTKAAQLGLTDDKLAGLNTTPPASVLPVV